MECLHIRLAMAWFHQLQPSQGPGTNNYLLFLLFLQVLAFYYSLSWAFTHAQVCQLKSSMAALELHLPALGITVFPPVHKQVSWKRKPYSLRPLLISHLSSVYRSLASVPDNLLEMLSGDIDKSNPHFLTVTNMISQSLHVYLFSFVSTPCLLRYSFLSLYDTMTPWLSSYSLGLSLCHFSLFWSERLVFLRFHPGPYPLLLVGPSFLMYSHQLHPHGSDFGICVHSQVSLLSSWPQYPTACWPSSVGWVTTSQSQHMQNEILHSFPCHHLPSPSPSFWFLDLENSTTVTKPEIWPQETWPSPEPFIPSSHPYTWPLTKPCLLSDFPQNQHFPPIPLPLV